MLWLSRRYVVVSQYTLTPSIVSVILHNASIISLESRAKPLQAFHWFATKAALQEIHRVLRPHGVLALLWNIEDYNSPRTYAASTPWESRMRELTWTFQDDEARFRHQEWKKVFEDQSRSSPWSLLVAGEQYFALPLGEWEERFEVWMWRRQVWERYATISSVVVLGEEEREVSCAAVITGGQPVELTICV